MLIFTTQIFMLTRLCSGRFIFRMYFDDQLKLSQCELLHIHSCIGPGFSMFSFVCAWTVSVNSYDDVSGTRWLWLWRKTPFSLSHSSRSVYSLLSRSSHSGDRENALFKVVGNEEPTNLVGVCQLIILHLRSRF